MPLLNYITWNVSPWLYEGEHFAIGWYGTLVTLSSITLLATYLFLLKKDKLPMAYALVLFMATTILTYLFGHITHCIFYEWYNDMEPLNILGMKITWRNPKIEHPWSFFDLRHGGFASHGCVVGGVLTALALRKYMRCDFYWLFDRIMVGACSMLFVRIGNLMTQQIYGVPTTLPWGFLFEGEELPAHPTQLYEIGYFLVAYIVGLWLFAKKDAGHYRGLLSGLMLLMIFIPRFAIEFVKNPQGSFETGWFLNMGQLLSVPFIIWGGIKLYQSIKEGIRTDIAPVTTLNHQERKQLKKK